MVVVVEGSAAVVGVAAAEVASAVDVEAVIIVAVVADVVDEVR